MKSNEGIYIPTGLQKGIVIRAAIDNINAQVDTTDGKNSFHVLASAIFQTKPGKDEEVNQLMTSLNLQVQRHREPQDATKTLISLIRCNLTGNPKPSRKWKYVEFKPFQYRESYLPDKVWLADVVTHLWLEMEYNNKSHFGLGINHCRAHPQRLQT